MGHHVGKLAYAGLWWTLGWGMLVSVVYLSLTPAPLVVIEFDFADKLEHFAAYAGLMGWFTQLVRRRIAEAGWFLGLVLMGIGLEILQGLGGVRHFEVFDMLANAAGVLLGWVLSRTVFDGALAGLDRFLSTVFRGRKAYK